MQINQNSKASVEFDITRPLNLSRSKVESAPLDGSPVAYIYSPAADGANGLRVAIVSIANVCGLSTDQVEALTNRIADEIIAPSFTDDDVEDVAFELMDIDGVHSTVCDHHRERARHVLDGITRRRQFNAKAVHSV